MGKSATGFAIRQINPRPSLAPSPGRPGGLRSSERDPPLRISTGMKNDDSEVPREG